ncbi:MAG TPA: hypothetical protein VKE50_09950 [Thermoanaerobaculia bacterium]|nr:hypothetical protein [Thermoanaerobaculia bacterium]
MSDLQERLEELVARGRRQRLNLASEIGGVREEVEARRTQLRIAGWLAGGVAAGATAAYKLFGRQSLYAKVGRYSSTASLLFALIRGALRLRRFFL